LSDPADEKIELLVRSVLAAVDARLVEVRSEIQAVASDVERRHQQVLAHLQSLEQQRENQVPDSALLEHIEALHRRNTIATNERFALINLAIEQLKGEVVVPATIAVPMADLDGVNAPLLVGTPTGQVPVVPPLAPAAVTFSRVPPVAAPRCETSEEAPEPIDMSRLADLLTERLGSMSLEPHQPQH